jgi:hypothetical protein
MKKYSNVMANKSYFVGLFFLTIFSLAISGWPKSSLATDYYVDNTCTYNGNGTSQACATGAGQPGPFNSRANAQTAVTGSHPDDRLLFRAGQSFPGLYTVRAYGTPGHPFTISSYGTGAKPIFDGGGSGGYPSWGVISIINLSNITLDGLAVTNGKYGIWIYRSAASSPTNGIIVRNCACYNNWVYGLTYYNEPGLARPDLSDSALYDNDSYQNASGIFVMRVDNLSIYRNTCRDNLLNGTEENYGIAVEGGSGLKIYENIVANNYSNGIAIYGDTGTDGPSNYNKVFRNIIYGTKYPPSGPWVWSNDIAWQGQVGSYNAIYYNILYSTDSRAQHFVDDTASSTGNVFYGNVLANGQYGMLTSGGSWLVKNNIFYNNRDYNVHTGAGGLTFGNNLYYKSGGGTLVAHNGVTYTSANITSLDAGAKITDPRFINPLGDWTGFILQSDSPAIDAGANLGSPYNFALNPDDLYWPPTTADQNSNGASWDIGAFVYKQSSPTPSRLAPPTGLRVVQ